MLDDDRIKDRLELTRTSFTVVVDQTADIVNEAVPPEHAGALRRSSRRRTNVPSYAEAYQLHRPPPLTDQIRLAREERQRLMNLVEVRPDGLGGHGLFARQDIETGLRLMYFGETIDAKELRRRYPRGVYTGGTEPAMVARTTTSVGCVGGGSSMMPTS